MFAVALFTVILELAELPVWLPSTTAVRVNVYVPGTKLRPVMEAPGLIVPYLT